MPPANALITSITSREENYQFITVSVVKETPPRTPSSTTTGDRGGESRRKASVLLQSSSSAPLRSLLLLRIIVLAASLLVPGLNSLHRASVYQIVVCSLEHGLNSELPSCDCTQCAAPWLHTPSRAAASTK